MTIGNWLRIYNVSSNTSSCNTCPVTFALIELKSKETGLHLHIGSHNKSFRETSTSRASPSTLSYEIPHLNVGGPSNRSIGDGRCNSPTEVNSVTYPRRISTFNMNKWIKTEHTAEKIPTLLISMSVYSPGIRNSRAGRRVSMSFSSRSAPRIAIILSMGKAAGPSSLCGI